MRSSLKLLVFVAFFVSPFCYTQEKQKPTVFITTDDKPEDKKVYEGRGLFSQFSGAIYFVGNKNAGKRIEGSDDTESAFLPDGLKAHAGFGAHLKEWTGISVNGGIDYQINPKLVFTPVYGTVFLNPHFGMDSSFVLEAGYGWAFALGRGDLSGFYQKYRLGYMNSDRISIFIEYNQMGFTYNDYKLVGGISIGLSIYNFL